MSILEQESVNMIQHVIANPPQTVEQLNMAMAVHVRTSIELRMKMALLGVPLEELDEDRELMNKFWAVLAEAMEEDLPFGYPDEDAELPGEFTLTNEAGDKGVICRPVPQGHVPNYGNNPFQVRRSRVFHVQGNHTIH